MALEGLNNLKISPAIPDSGVRKSSLDQGIKGEFSNQLEEILGRSSEKFADPKAPLSIKFSNHAIERMRSRGIHFDSETLQKIENIVERAKEKGVKETLIMSENAAMILNIENKTVVTVMDKNMLKENIFTNIDAAAII